MKSFRSHKHSSIFASFTVHGFLLLSLFIFLLRDQEEGQQGPQTIQFESITENKPTPKRHSLISKSQVGHSSDSPSLPHAIALSDLGLKINVDRLSSPQEQIENVDSEAVVEDGWDLRNPDPRIARFNQYIYNTVQGWLDRDVSIDSQRIFGTVKVKIWFDENGEYLEAETEYEAADPNFQKIVAKALRNSFTNPIPKPFLFQRKKFSIERMVVIRGYS